MQDNYYLRSKISVLLLFLIHDLICPTNRDWPGLNLENKMNNFEKLQELHCLLMALKSNLELCDSHEQAKKFLTPVNESIASKCGGAYGECTYLFEACGIRLNEITNDFYDRIEKKGDYAE